MFIVLLLLPVELKTLYSTRKYLLRLLGFPIIVCLSDIVYEIAKYSQ